MRPAAAALLLLSCWLDQNRASALPHDDVSAELPVLWDELRGLKELVLSLKVEEVGRRQAMRGVESRLRDEGEQYEQQRRSMERLDQRLEELKEQSQARASEVSNLQSRLTSTDGAVEDLRKKNSALAGELPFLQTRLRASESTVEQLRRRNAVLSARLCNSESLTEDLRRQISELQAANVSLRTPSEVSTAESQLNVRLVKLEENTEAQTALLGQLQDTLNRTEHHLHEEHIESTEKLSRMESRLTEGLSYTEELLSRLRTNEEQLENLKTQHEEQNSDVMELWRKLNVTEKLQDKLNTVLISRLSSSEDHLEGPKTEKSDVEIRLKSTEMQLRQMETRTADLEVKLKAKEEHLQDLETENSAQTALLGQLQDTLNRTEHHLHEEHIESTEKLSRMESRLTEGLSYTEELLSRLRTNEEQLENLKTQHEARGEELEVVWLRLNGTEKQLAQLRRQSSDQQLTIAASQKQLELLQTQNSDLEVRLKAKEEHVQDLETENSAQTALLGQLQDTLNRTEHHLHEEHIESTEKLSRMESRLTEGLSYTEELLSRLKTNEEQLENLKTQHEDLQLTITASQKQLELLQTQNSDLEVRLKAKEEHLQDLETEKSAQTALLGQLQDTLNRTEHHLHEEHIESTEKLSRMESRLTEGLSYTEELLSRLKTNEEQLENLKTQHEDLQLTITASQKQLELLQTQNSDLEVRLKAKEEHLQDLETENSAQTALLGQLQDTLNRTEHHLHEEHIESTEKLSRMESRLTEGLSYTEELLSRLKTNEEQLENLKTQHEDLQLTITASQKQQELLQTQNSDLQLTITASQKQLELMQTQNSDLEVRLKAKEEHLQDLETENSAQTALLGQLQDTLNRTEHHLHEEHIESTEKLSRMESRLTEGLSYTQELLSRLRTNEEQLENLKTQHEGRLKVGFSAGLSDSGLVGPFNEESTLIFSKTLANIGEAYNQSAGVFTAPVGGLYSFSFTAADYLKGYMGLYLYRNNQPILFSLDLNDHGGYASTSGTVAVQLERGDEISLRLPASYRLYDDTRNFSIFSGFLVFPL